MPTEANRYPFDWKKIVARIRKRSKGRCECRSECGLHTTTGRCTEQDRRPAKFARGVVILTTAHMCHNKPCRRMNHLKHMCNRCHLRYDLELHMRHAQARRHERKAIRDLFEADRLFKFAVLESIKSYKGTPCQVNRSTPKKRTT